MDCQCPIQTLSSEDTKLWSLATRKADIVWELSPGWIMIYLHVCGIIYAWLPIGLAAYHLNPVELLGVREPEQNRK